MNSYRNKARATIRSSGSNSTPRALTDPTISRIFRTFIFSRMYIRRGMENSQLLRFRGSARSCRRLQSNMMHWKASDLERKNMTLKRMDNVLIVVDDLEAVKAFFFA